MYQNYIFDLYGTLADIWTNEDRAGLWKKMSLYMSLQEAFYIPAELHKEYARLVREVRTENWKAHFLSLFGKTPHARSKEDLAVLPMEEIEISLEQVITRLYGKKGVQATREIIENWALTFRALSMDYVRLYPGAGKVLKELKHQGKNIYLLSNAQRLFTEPEMRSLQIYDIFDDILYSSDIGFAKPSTCFFNALLQKHHLDPAVSVMIGNDCMSDAWGASRAGLDSIYIHTIQSPEPEGELPAGCKRISALEDILTIS